MTPNENHVSDCGKAFKEKARTIKIFTPEFSQFLLKLFPKNTSLAKHLLNGFSNNTIRRIESACEDIRQSLNSGCIIRDLEMGNSERLLDLAYRKEAAEILLRRCQEAEAEIPIL